MIDLEGRTEIWQFQRSASRTKNERNMALRLGDTAPNFTANYKQATPADWKEGQDCIAVTAVSDEDAARMFPKAVRKVKPYLRYTPQPNHPQSPAHAR